VRPFTYYPNPAKEQLHMQFSPDVQPKQIELYDLQGRLVRTQSKAFESIDMSQLPAGTYTLRVTMEDGKTYSDKVVKE
ncbi:MAG: T9SS type A sorting domain-containing protein, partial [Bacteroidales bacterium]|nr:T9SS type A sorting domain-containing protein [Bacteroidales bacterium]